MNIVTDTIE